MTPEKLEKLQKAITMLFVVQGLMDDIGANKLLTHKAKMTFTPFIREVDKVIADFHKGAADDVVEEYYQQVKQFEAFCLAWANNEIQVID